MRVRPLVEGELPEVVRTINEKYMNSYEFIPLKDRDLFVEIQERKMRVLVAEDEGEVIGVVAIRLTHWGEEIRWLSVQDCPGRQQIEDLLVEEAEKLVENVNVFTVVGSDNPNVHEWLRRGYRIEGGLNFMIAKLDTPKAIAPVRESAILRSLRLGEEELLISLVNRAYGWKRLSLDTIREWRERDAPFDEGWVHVAEVESELVSAIVCRPDGLGKNRGYLGPIATLQEHRKLGLASALMARGMNFLLGKGMSSAVLYASEMNVASTSLYGKLGFKVAYYWRFLYKRSKRA